MTVQIIFTESQSMISAASYRVMVSGASLWALRISFRANRLIWITAHSSPMGPIPVRRSGRRLKWTDLLSFLSSWLLGLQHYGSIGVMCDECRPILRDGAVVVYDELVASQK